MKALIRPNRYYRHLSAIDVDMHVLAIKYAGTRYLKLKVAWVSQRNHELVHSLDSVKLMREDLNMWREVEMHTHVPLSARNQEAEK